MCICNQKEYTESVCRTVQARVNGFTGNNQDRVILLRYNVGSQRR